jgi:hypothetical protein
MAHRLISKEYRHAIDRWSVLLLYAAGNGHDFDWTI